MELPEAALDRCLAVNERLECKSRPALIITNVGGRIQLGCFKAQLWLYGKHFVQQKNCWTSFILAVAAVGKLKAWWLVRFIKKRYHKCNVNRNNIEVTVYFF